MYSPQILMCNLVDIVKLLFHQHIKCEAVGGSILSKLVSPLKILIESVRALLLKKATI